MVQVSEFAVRSGAPYQTGNGFDDQTEIALAGAKLVFGLLSFTDIAEEAGEYFMSVSRQFTKRNFYGKLFAIFAQADERLRR